MLKSKNFFGGNIYINNIDIKTAEEVAKKIVESEF